MNWSKRAFFYRGGSHMTFLVRRATANRTNVFACKIITGNPGDGVGFAAWPAYRLSSGQLWGMQRLNDCFRQQHFPYPGFASDVTIAGRLHGRQREGASLAPKR
jgi:sulfur-oxidizing protein SoxA